jgi:uncharacterized protein
MLSDPRLSQIVASQPYPLLFVTISGAHLYGFPSPDSDYDLRGAHILPLMDVIGLVPKKETIEVTRNQDGLEMDLVTHDIAKFFSLLIRPNGYVLEQLFSPLVVHTTPEHEELKQLAWGCITNRHSHHYLGFAESQWRLFNRESPHRVKPLLYVYRVLLTGIHLMETGEIEANLIHLNDIFRLAFLPDLIARKLAGPEKSILDDADLEFHRQEYDRLTALLKREAEKSHLPDMPSARPALNDLLVRVRMESRL